MKKTLIILAVLIFMVFGFFYFYQIYFKQTQNVNLKNMIISSPSFENNQMIPAKFTCDGESINPALKFSGTPEKAQSLILIMDDPDAPSGTFMHWLLWNIDPKIAEIAENSAPASAVQGITGYGKTGYGPPCPPSGTHRYYFKIYALDKMLDLQMGADKSALEKAMTGHVLDSGELIGLYNRN